MDLITHSRTACISFGHCDDPDSRNTDMPSQPKPLQDLASRIEVLTISLEHSLPHDTHSEQKHHTRSSLDASPLSFNLSISAVGTSALTRSFPGSTQAVRDVMSADHRSEMYNHSYDKSAFTWSTTTIKAIHDGLQVRTLFWWFPVHISSTRTA